MKHRLIVGSDDAGLKYKNAILEDLQNDPRASSVQDVGVNNDDPTACTYGEISIKAATPNLKRRDRPGHSDLWLLQCRTIYPVQQLPGADLWSARDRSSTGT